MGNKISIREVAAVLASLKGQRECCDFLEAILTKDEKTIIGLRWKLVCLLAQGLCQRDIAKKLGVSLCKITRGSRELKRRPAFRKIVMDFISKKSRKGKECHEA